MISGVIRCGACVYCSFMLLTYALLTKYVYKPRKYNLSGNWIEHQHLCTCMLHAKGLKSNNLVTSFVLSLKPG